MLVSVLETSAPSPPVGVDVDVDVDVDSVGICGTNSNSLSSLAIDKLWFPREKSRARDAGAWSAASRWTRKRPEDCSAVSVSEGRRTLNEMMGSGRSVTVLKEETVMPRKARVGLLGSEGSVEVMMATG